MSATTSTSYEGKNPDLREHPCCRSCGQEPSSSLVRCSRCKLARYCNVDCQKRDYPQHKKTCRAIERLQAKMEQEAECLKVYQEWGTGEPTNLFETAVGDFWGLMETRDYMRARIDLCLKQEELAKQVQTREAWTVVLNHHLECLRLSKGDNMGLRIVVPFLLLRLNRDDDAYCFCRYWLKNGAGEEEESEIDHSDTREGDWIYPQLENCRFLDIFQECGPNALGLYSEITFVLAIAVIKMRLVAVYDHRVKQVEAFTLTTSSMLLGPDEQTEVRRSIMGSAEEEETLSGQRAQLNALLDALQERNASVVPALLHPDPLMSQTSPQYYSPGTPTEAHMLLKHGIYVWRQIPGANAFLELRFGTSTPSYPTNMQMR